eukprot:7388349-Prymnesium_polylepis.5
MAVAVAAHQGLDVQGRQQRLPLACVLKELVPHRRALNVIRLHFLERLQHGREHPSRANDAHLRLGEARLLDQICQGDDTQQDGRKGAEGRQHQSKAPALSGETREQ